MDKWRALRLAGRCLNGAERDGGRVYHAVPVTPDTHMPYEKALCGTTYGRTSAGWALARDGDTVTCQRCRGRLYAQSTRFRWADKVTGDAHG